MTDDTPPLPEEDAERVANDESLEDEVAYRQLMALLIAQMGFMASVMISIDEKLGHMIECDGGERVH